MCKRIDVLGRRPDRFLCSAFTIIAVVSLLSLAALTGCSGDGGTPTDDGTSQQNGITPLPIDEDNGDVAAVAPPDASPEIGGVDPDNGDNGDDPNGGENTPKPTDGTSEVPVEPPPENGDNGGVGPTPQPAVEEVPPLVPEIKPVSPKVLLSGGHQQMCRVNVGDTMPDLTLADIEGNQTSLAALYGPKLTAVLFWTANHPYAKEQFERIEREIVKPYGKYGVAAVTINEGDTAEAVKTLAGQPAVAFPMLLDAEGAALSAVATEKLPRTYLLDASGQVLWFDMEYSESTRRELKNAILWHLTK